MADRCLFEYNRYMTKLENGIRVWTTYMVRCRDGSLYTGYTVGDAARRCAVHNSGRGARYTRSRLPVALVWQHAFPSAHEARSCEALVKRLTKREKEMMVAAYSAGVEETLPEKVRERMANG